LHGAQFTGPRLASGMLWGEGEHGVEIAGWIERPARRREPDLCTRFTVDVSAADAASIEQWMQVQRSPGAAIGPAVAVPLAIGRR
jgi:hypothetical protein